MEGKASMRYAIIPARGGSKGIPRKNIKLLGGKPLIAYSIEAAKESGCFEHVIVSTEDAEIVEVSRQYGAEVKDRPAELATDHVHSVYTVLDCIQHYNMAPDDVVCMLLPTSPFRTAEDINNAVKLLDKSCNSVVSVVKCDHTVSSFRYINTYHKLMDPIVEVENYEAQRQGSDLYEVNGSIYVSTAISMTSNRSFHRARIKPYIMSKAHSLDINDEWDWLLANLLMDGK